MENEILNNEMQSADQQIADTADQQDDFLKGFDEEDTIPTDSIEEGDEEGAAANASAENTPAEEKPAESAEDTPAAEGEEAPKGEQTAPISWTFKHMGEDKTITAQDITPELLQKAADYDRVRGKYDESKPAMEIFRKFAEKANMSLGDYVKHIRQMAKEAEGMNKQEAQRAVELEDREAAVAAKETAQNEEQSKKDEAAAKVQADLAEFQRVFPDVYEKVKADRNAIDQSVWDAVVQENISLTAAYARYAVNAANAAAASAKERSSAAEKNGHNAARSTGSMQSAGNDRHLKDAFLMGFDD